MPENILASLRVFTGYAQVGVYDVEAQSGGSQWETGEEEIICDSTGVVVATADHTDIRIVVFDGMIGHGEPDTRVAENDQSWRLVGTGVIQVGKRGLQVGHEVDGEYANIWWNPGSTRVTVYGRGAHGQITSVHFVLDALD